MVPKKKLWAPQNAETDPNVDADHKRSGTARANVLQLPSLVADPGFVIGEAD